MSRTFTRTYLDIALGDVESVSFARGTTSPTGWFVIAKATVRADDGVSYAVTMTKEATAGQRTQIENFITNNVVGALNTQEGLA